MRHLRFFPSGSSVPGPSSGSVSITGGFSGFGGASATNDRWKASIPRMAIAAAAP